jgi:hypothetical protein
MAVQVPHTTLQLRVDDVTGLTSLSLTVVVSGQSSNTVEVAVTPPSLTALRLYDTAALVRHGWAGTRCVPPSNFSSLSVFSRTLVVAFLFCILFIPACEHPSQRQLCVGGWRCECEHNSRGGRLQLGLQCVVLLRCADRRQQCVRRVGPVGQGVLSVVISGATFHSYCLPCHTSRHVSCALTLAILSPARSSPCVPCFLTHTKARCITAASKASALNLTASVSGQRSNPLPYLYADVVSSTPPNIVSVTVTSVSSSSQLRTVGNDTIVIVGEYFVTGFRTASAGVAAAKGKLCAERRCVQRQHPRCCRHEVRRGLYTCHCKHRGLTAGSGVLQHDNNCGADVGWRWYCGHHQYGVWQPIGDRRRYCKHSLHLRAAGSDVVGMRVLSSK